MNDKLTLLRLLTGRLVSLSLSFAMASQAL